MLEVAGRGPLTGLSINAIWYVLWTGCQWKALHRDWFGVCASVVHECFQKWSHNGRL